MFEVFFKLVHDLGLKFVSAISKFDLNLLDNEFMPSENLFLLG